MTEELEAGDRVVVVEDRWPHRNGRSRVGWRGRIRTVRGQRPRYNSLNNDVLFYREGCLWFSTDELKLVSGLESCFRVTDEPE